MKKSAILINAAYLLVSAFSIPSAAQSAQKSVFPEMLTPPVKVTTSEHPELLVSEEAAFAPSNKAFVPEDPNIRILEIRTGVWASSRQELPPAKLERAKPMDRGFRGR